MSRASAVLKRVFGGDQPSEPQPPTLAEQLEQAEIAQAEAQARVDGAQHEHDDTAATQGAVVASAENAFREDPSEENADALSRLTLRSRILVDHKLQALRTLKTAHAEAEQVARAARLAVLEERASIPALRARVAILAKDAQQHVLALDAVNSAILEDVRATREAIQAASIFAGEDGETRTRRFTDANFAGGSATHLIRNSVGFVLAKRVIALLGGD